MTVPFWPPNVARLQADRDVDGLRDALRHGDWRVRDSAARALGELELPPGATQRRSIVPQEAVADLVACWDQMMTRYRNSFGAIKAAPDFEIYGGAMARIGGKAGWRALLELHGRGREHWGHWMDEEAWYSMFQGAFQLFPVDELVATLLDENQPAEVRALMRGALQLKARSAGVDPAEAARSLDAIAAYKRRAVQRELEDIEAHLDDLIRRHDIEKLVKSRDPRAIRGIVVALFCDDAKFGAAHSALRRIGAPAASELILKLQAPGNGCDGVRAARDLLSGMLESQSKDFSRADLLILADLGDLECVAVYESRDQDDRSESREFRERVDFSSIRGAARGQLRLRGGLPPRPASRPPVDRL